ncbi:MAG TPA: 8-oxo-dGTP diphosphatase MutT [Methylomirabilota bacterium]|nr:8-oxo-dGTP diphosphatase MutT [Methylomirabilota bacterium]
MPLVIEVAAGLVRDATGRYLITQRRRGSHLAGLWEFPGGKVEASETPAECLRRELSEELAATFAVGEPVETVRWEYPDRTVVLHFFDCRVESGEIVPLEGQAMAWVEPHDLAAHDFPPADRELIRRLGRRGEARDRLPPSS